MSEQKNTGTIAIKPQVLFTLALNAAKNTYGVIGIASRYTGYDTTIRDPHRGLEIKITPREGQAPSVAVDIHVIIEYGVRIPSVVSSLQHQISYGIEHGTGYSVEDVKVHVASVRVSNGK
ncbi:MAG TPA: Asp23/Gls24 family envelope stress response protein [Thermoflexales bacterium]|nr:Asp23/Gls24 family envelope stress response protein [Thermoflexales bacterium]HQW34877.1 Asp23/Gls24 family envelope stress response protein [Thermoflexales bacterium]HQZ21051.1 Asp23/Gls24 family envelope stress response protein [Thermoflexales bacterium]HQZ98568.1 Asp23/Gls24 family envelope stress response protein [Thermoflexales bacterium]